MKTEDMNNEMDGVVISDEMLDGIVGGTVQKHGNHWDVVNDSTSEVVKSFDSRQAAVAYAKKYGYDPTVIK